MRAADRVWREKRGGPWQGMLHACPWVAKISCLEQARLACLLEEMTACFYRGIGGDLWKGTIAGAWLEMHVDL